MWDARDSLTAGMNSFTPAGHRQRRRGAMFRERWQRIDPVARLKGHSMKTKFELEL